MIERSIYAMKKIFSSKMNIYLLLFIIALFSVSLNNISVKPVSKKNINLISVKYRKKVVTKKKIKLNVGDCIKLFVNAKPKKNISKITLRSANKKIAVVKKGKIKALKKGNVKIYITVISKNKQKKNTFVILKVNKKYTPIVNKLYLDKTNLNIMVGQKIYLNAVVKRNNKVQHTSIYWTSSNSNIAKVSNGVITAMGVGNAIITAGLTTGEKAICKITVENNTSNDWLTYKNKSLLSAHRGATTVAPENTIEAINQAIKLNYAAIELDPRVSADGEVYLMHDETVDRTTNGSGKISEMSSEEIDSLLINKDSYPNITEDIHVAKFEEAVKIIADSNLILNIDGGKMDYSDKNIASKIVNILQKYNMLKRCFIVLTDPEIRKSFHEMYPDICLSWLYDKNNSITEEIKKIKEYDRAMLSIHISCATKGILKALNEAGIYYQVYSVQDSKVSKELFAQGVPMVETDCIVP